MLHFRTATVSWMILCNVKEIVANRRFFICFVLPAIAACKVPFIPTGAIVGSISTVEDGSIELAYNELLSISCSKIPLKMFV